jgi:NADH-quinone oxidoreductase subunit B
MVGDDGAGWPTGTAPTARDGAGGWVTTRLDVLANWSRSNSLWIMPFFPACCGIEMMAALASKYDLARFGMERLSFSPRQADVLVCAGRVSYKMAPVLRRIWDQMPQPKWSVALGACASSGGMFDTYSIVQGIDTIIPVDVYVPGCPPRPEAVIYALQLLQEKIRGESVFDAERHRRSRAESPEAAGQPQLPPATIEAVAVPFGNSAGQNRGSGFMDTGAVARPRDRLESTGAAPQTGEA